MRTISYAVLCLFAAHIAADPAPATPLLSELFQDHAVLQRDRPIPVWGQSVAGDRLTVSINGGTVQARADATGHWSALLPAMHAGGPYTLSVRAKAGASQSMADILIGDVFLCSGQSNMELAVARAFNAEREIANSRNEQIRLLTVAHGYAASPLKAFQSTVTWSVASPTTVSDFSASCYFFARELHQSQSIPLGLIHASWGGSRIEPWISDVGLRSKGGFDARLDLLKLYAGDAKLGNDRLGSEWESWWHTRAPTAPWREALGEWREVPEPMRDWKTWGVDELKNHDGMIWFRRTATVTAQQAAGPATLTLGGIDEVDETWVNGTPVGNSFGYGTERTYALPAGTLLAGENSIVVNVLSVYDAAGMYGPAEHMSLRYADGSSTPLGGHWRYQFVPEEFGYPPRAPWESVGGLTTLYNAMISPLGAYGLRGVIWYQGESNASEAAQYQTLLATLMRDWRRVFGETLPFLIVQLPNFGPRVATPTESDWSNLREAQRLAVLTDTRAALTVTIDVGEPRELHPPDKQSVGKRLARAARHLIYREAVTASGPIPLSADREGDHVIVKFGDVVGALVSYSSNRAGAFELCGPSKGSCRFVDALVQPPDRIVLDGAGIEGVTRVRFCWGDAPICNLYDQSGLPAGPFEIPLNH